MALGFMKVPCPWLCVLLRISTSALRSAGGFAINVSEELTTHILV